MTLSLPHKVIAAAYNLLFQTVRAKANSKRPSYPITKDITQIIEVTTARRVLCSTRLCHFYCRTVAVSPATPLPPRLQVSQLPSQKKERSSRSLDIPSGSHCGTIAYCYHLLHWYHDYTQTHCTTWAWLAWASEMFLCLPKLPSFFRFFHIQGKMKASWKS